MGPRPLCGRSHATVLHYPPVEQFQMNDLAEIDVSGIPGAGGLEILVNRLAREVAALRLQVGQLKQLVRMPDSFSRDEAEKLLNAKPQPVRRIETSQQEPPRRRRTKKRPAAQEQEQQQPQRRPIRITGSLD